MYCDSFALEITFSSAEGGWGSFKNIVAKIDYCMEVIESIINTFVFSDAAYQIRKLIMPAVFNMYVITRFNFIALLLF